VLSVEVVEVSFLEFADVGGGDLVEVSLDSSVQHANLLFSGHGHVLLLLQELGQLFSSVEEVLGGSVEIRSELGEGSDLSVLGELELHRSRDLLHCLNLGSGSDSRDGETDINGRSDTSVEKLGFEENLSVSDRNNVGRDISRDISSLGLDNGEGGEGASSVVLVHLGGSFEQTRMEVENISGVGFSTGGSSEEQGHLSVSNGLLGEIVVDNQGVLSVVSEVLSDSASGVGGQELEGSGIRSGSSDDTSVGHRAFFFELSYDVGDGRSLLANGDVDAVKLLLIVSHVEGFLLVNNSVDGNCGLSGLSVTNDEFSLSSSNGHEGVDGLEAGLHGLVDGLSGDNSGGLELNSLSAVALNRAGSVDRGSEGVDDSSEHAFTNRNIDDRSSSLDDIAFLNFSVVSEDDDSDVVGFEVKSHSLDSGAELHHFSGLDLHESEDSGNSISNRDDGSEFLQVVLHFKR